MSEKRVDCFDGVLNHGIVICWVCLARAGEIESWALQPSGSADPTDSGYYYAQILKCIIVVIVS